MDRKNQNGNDQNESYLSVFLEKSEKKTQIKEEIPGGKRAKTPPNPVQEREVQKGNYRGRTWESFS